MSIRFWFHKARGDTSESLPKKNNVKMTQEKAYAILEKTDAAYDEDLKAIGIIIAYHNMEKKGFESGQALKQEMKAVREQPAFEYFARAMKNEKTSLFQQQKDMLVRKDMQVQRARKLGRAIDRPLEEKWNQEEILVNKFNEKNQELQAILQTGNDVFSQRDK